MQHGIASSRSGFFTMLCVAAASNALLTPIRRAHAPRMQIERPKDWYYDNVEFMNEPFKFIMDHPADFSEAMQAMAQYQFMTEQDSRPWGELPMYLAEGAQIEQSLQRKSMQADGLAKVIMTADLPTMRELASDAKFAEKKNLFQRLAALPQDHGMLTIHEIISEMKETGQLPALTAFPADLAQATQKVAEANEALRKLDETYTALFLAVRVTDKLSSAAAQMKAGGQQGGPQPRGEMPPPQPRQDSVGMPPPRPPQPGQGGLGGGGGRPLFPNAPS